MKELRFLFDAAKEYDDFREFIEFVGYRDWMDDFLYMKCCPVYEGDELSTYQCALIDSLLMDIWLNSHHMSGGLYV